MTGEVPGRAVAATLGTLAEAGLELVPRKKMEGSFETEGVVEARRYTVAGTTEGAAGERRR